MSIEIHAVRHPTNVVIVASVSAIAVANRASRIVSTVESFRDLNRECRRNLSVAKKRIKKICIQDVTDKYFRARCFIFFK